MQQNQGQTILQVGQFLQAPLKNYPERIFRINKVLGAGGEGIVYQAESINCDKIQQYALKIHNYQQKNEYVNFIDNLINYQCIHENPLSSNCKPVYMIRTEEKFYLNMNKLVLVMELGSQNLYELQKQNGNINMQTIGNYCIYMAKSIHFLHSNNLIHRDIKPENYIVVGQHIKLIDFGLIKLNTNAEKTANVGTPLYKAPELVQEKQQYTEKVDIWSLGCVFFELIKKEPLFNFERIEDISKQILNHLNDQNYVYLKINQLQISENWKQTLKQMLHPCPQNRLSIVDVLLKIEKTSIINANLIIQPILLNNNFPPQNLQPQNMNFSINQNQNFLQQITSLIQTFQSPNIINQLKQHNQAISLISKLIELSKEIQSRLFPQNSQGIKDKINFVSNLIQEIENDEKCHSKQQNLFSQILELYGKKEASLKILQLEEEKESAINNLQSEISDEQKLKQELSERKKQKIEELEKQNKLAKEALNNKSQKNKTRIQKYDFQNIDQELKNQNEKIIILQTQLNILQHQEQVFNSNVEKIKQLENDVKNKQQFQQQFNESAYKVVSLQIEYEKLQDVEKKLISSSEEIENLSGMINQLKSKRDQFQEQEYRSYQLQGQIIYLNKQMENFQQSVKQTEEEYTKLLEYYKIEEKKYDENLKQYNNRIKSMNDYINKLNENKMQLDQQVKLLNQNQLKQEQLKNQENSQNFNIETKNNEIFLRTEQQSRKQTNQSFIASEETLGKSAIYPTQNKVSNFSDSSKFNKGHSSFHSYSNQIGNLNQFS